MTGLPPSASIIIYPSSIIDQFSCIGAQAIALRTKLNKLEKKADDKDPDLNYWREQNELLRGIPADTPFGSIDEGKKAKRGV